MSYPVFSTLFMHFKFVQQVLPHSVIFSLSGLQYIYMWCDKPLIAGFLSFCKGSQAFCITGLLLLEHSNTELNPTELHC